ncbi:MAG: tRNA (adenosine(37)-N6)-threonylcarbamoyltransferase complex dimerization subunit type 1 TsaB [Oceanospirillaceae bacterium]|jgi:tRNA threonylcarbamoyladenosine biosynthesis protein TsaB|uniref:tRNA (adenosine(37)-N6)-threonylcarbamoyltransferase complex dimerization subunit type 1 TsaB n=1 Tax=Thalassolituus sp. TaxID=2030822 RepID=UPI000B641951|nr:tRNA (adenosine(37)-N6)-threonylcarbamoyltransferase complex dimerization subunit type 1 TsaB [Thalassolituus sp.]MAE34088.1 tRNA (adenosine(37)-N6)-threonylcarbamoyltransferase complex dimerization subunit type 1 TsaB [Oceanospirillaceae bacterium]MDQ4423103.1 tRNA (adenosine(37)-N6)-threonylcarbamoyltransferase complex dimerization subunit type 1 TsaB [Thalassolituus sp.]MDQ4425211.1 tRNA (adenosine(37)-N6)-threonylcarbamoyltransferase complex dimerization subunit type 1 TsaB [Thalassolituu|tara:strand:- start:6059 stop:6754 length:696 start_codon:yes stop_codon:yes gene_type:complete
MSVILTIDASSSLCSVALNINGELVWNTEEQPRRHAQRLLPMIDDILADSGISRSQLDGLAFGRGPGSFTGIRIAVSVAQGLALGLDLPVCGISSLETVALAVASNGEPTNKVLAIMDAHMGEVFWGKFGIVDGLTVADGIEQVGAPELCQTQVETFEGVLAGDGLNLSAFDGVDSAYASVQPEARIMSVLADREWSKGNFGSPDNQLPVYLRNSVAWKKLDEQPSLLKRT